MLDDTLKVHVHDLYLETKAAAAGPILLGEFVYDGGDLRRHLHEHKPGRIFEIAKQRRELPLWQIMDRWEASEAGLVGMLTWRMSIGGKAPWIELAFDGQIQRWR